MSAKKSHSFLISLVQAKGKLVSYTTLTNGHSPAKISRHEFIARLEFTTAHDMEYFKDLFSGESEPTEIIGGSVY